MPKPEGYKSIHLHVPPDFHKMLKVAAAIKETTLRDYIVSLVQADLEKMKKKPEMQQTNVK